MNINPAQLATVAAEAPQPIHLPRPSTSVPPPERVSKTEKADTLDRRSIDAIPEEVVKVHTDTSTGQPIMVFEFVDSRSDSVIFQVPSEQMLNLVQEIRARLKNRSFSGNATARE